MKSRKGTKILITSDLHLTDKVMDSYRFTYLSWLRDRAERSQVGAVFILGDLTDSKDRHSAKLVNTTVDLIADLADATRYGVFLLKGNHDYVDSETPFFKFLNRIKKVKMVVHTEVEQVGDITFAAISHRPQTSSEWPEIARIFSQPECCVNVAFFHQTFDKSLTSQGFKLDGLKPSLFKKAVPKLYSGDIHVPQLVGPVEYVGAPYHINYGDSYVPRTILWEKGNPPKDLFWAGPRRSTVLISHPDELAKFDFAVGDQVKVRLSLSKEYYSNWDELTKMVYSIAEDLEIYIHGIELGTQSGKAKVPKFTAFKAASSKSIVNEYGKKEKIDRSTLKRGVEFVGKD